MSNKLPAIPIEPFDPYSWAKNAHLQTIFGYYLNSPRIKAEPTIHQTTLDDGDQLVSLYYPGKKDIMILLFHGLAGSSDSGYMQRIGQLAITEGYHVFLVNHRGAGPGKFLAHKPYHSGSAIDIESVLRSTRSFLPAVKQIAVGFSMSAAALLLNLTQTISEIVPDGAVTVNAPLDLGAASRLLSRGFNRVYDINFVKDCLADFRGRQERYPSWPQHKLPIYSKMRTIDHFFTAPFYGHPTAEDFYDAYSVKNHVGKIKTPTYVLTSNDDPFIPVSDYLEASFSESVFLQIEKFGGHVGYIASKSVEGLVNRWMDIAVLKAVENLIEFRRG